MKTYELTIWKKENSEFVKSIIKGSFDDCIKAKNSNKVSEDEMFLIDELDEKGDLTHSTWCYDNDGEIK